MQIVPLQAVPSQTLNVVLNGQQCSLNVYISDCGDILNYSNATLTSVFVDLYIGGVLIEGGMMGRTGVRLVRDSYLGFLGDLIFSDMQPDAILGPLDPQYLGLGNRWQLLYLFPSELNPLDV